MKTGNKPQTVTELLLQNLISLVLRKRPQFEHVQLPDIPPELVRRARSIFIRHLDCGSCNGCELELNALANPVYDSEQYGIRFEASPRHADYLAMTGPFTRSLRQAAYLTLKAMPEPKIIAIGDCALDGGIFKHSYAVNRRFLEGRFLPGGRSLGETLIITRVEGCPPSPEEILKALLALPPG